MQPRSRTGEKEEAGLRATSCTCTISSAYSGLHQYLAKREEEGNKTLIGRRGGQEGGGRLGRKVLRLLVIQEWVNLFSLLCAQDSDNLRTPLHPPGPSAASTDYCWPHGGRPKACPSLVRQECSFPDLPCPLQPPSRSITYSAGEGKDWKSRDLQFLRKRNNLAKVFFSPGAEPGGTLGRQATCEKGGTARCW